MTAITRPAMVLIKEMMSQAGKIPNYNEETVRLTIQEIQRCTEEMGKLHAEAKRAAAREAEQQGESDRDFDWSMQPERFAAVIVYHETILKLKRILLTYMKMRADCLREVRWQKRHLPQEVKDNLSPAEIEYYKEYDSCLNKYMGHGPEGIGMDLTLDMEPPKDMTVTVKVLKDHGTLATCGSIKINLTAGSTHNLQRSEAEPLIRAGVLQPMRANY